MYRSESQFERWVKVGINVVLLWSCLWMIQRIIEALLHFAAFLKGLP